MLWDNKSLKKNNVAYNSKVYGKIQEQRTSWSRDKHSVHVHTVPRSSILSLTELMMTQKVFFHSPAQPFFMWKKDEAISNGLEGDRVECGHIPFIS